MLLLVSAYKVRWHVGKERIEMQNSGGEGLTVKKMGCLANSILLIYWRGLEIIDGEIWR